MVFSVISKFVGLISIILLFNVKDIRLGFFLIVSKNVDLMGIKSKI